MRSWQTEASSGETGFANARIVLADEVVHGSLKVEDGAIVAIDSGRSVMPGAIDLDGDYLIPGLIDLHTDNLEKHFQPRKGVFWDGVAAALSHDAQVLAAGITTVFDSLTLGAADGWDSRTEMVQPMIDGMTEAHEHGLLRADHFLHLRCEVTHPAITSTVEQVVDHPLVRFMSLMDHAPGDRQSPDVERYRSFYLPAFNHDELALDRHIEDLVTKSRTIGPENRRALAALGQVRAVPLASHDDSRIEHVEEAAELGCTMTEFPTTVEAASAARALGLKVLMGGPNLIRGGSHTGNVAAGDLASSGHLNIFASDYIPSSMLAAAFKLTEAPFSWALPRAVQTVTREPAEATGLGANRGTIAPGLRADLVRVALINRRPVVRAVWRQGARIL
ncbi:MAG: alpha-D-ribose 1-methylphosphonate 5-triphosphate diphosphatase [Alphaproteobacteria bacterium]